MCNEMRYPVFIQIAFGRIPTRLQFPAGERVATIWDAVRKLGFVCNSIRLEHWNGTRWVAVALTRQTVAAMNEAGLPRR